MENKDMAIKEENVINSIVNSLKELKLHELNDLVQLVKEEFGLNDINFATSSNNEDSVKEEKKTTVSLVLTKVGDKKIPVYNTIKEMTGKGLLEIKKLTDTLPFVILGELNQSKAEELKAQLEAQGAQVELK
jgi:large subunit ribosomal protein L7/L12